MTIVFNAIPYVRYRTERIVVRPISRLPLSWRYQIPFNSNDVTVFGHVRIWRAAAATVDNDKSTQEELLVTILVFVARTFILIAKGTRCMNSSRTSTRDAAITIVKRWQMNSPMLFLCRDRLCREYAEKLERRLFINNFNVFDTWTKPIAFPTW